MIRYKVEVMKELKKNGYTAGICRRNKILSESTMTHFRRGEEVDWFALNKVCLILGCQISDILEVVPTEEELKHLGIYDKE